jgi:hypothetical protein
LWFVYVAKTTYVKIFTINVPSKRETNCFLENEWLSFHFIKLNHPMRKMRLLSICTYLISISLYALSLTQSVWECGKGGTPFSGAMVLISGYMGLLFFDPRWFCNVSIIIATISIFRSRLVWSLRWFFAISITATTTIFGPYLCAVGAGPLGDGTGFSLGGWLWIASLWFTTLSMFFVSKSESSVESVMKGG